MQTGTEDGSIILSANSISFSKESMGTLKKAGQMNFCEHLHIVTPQVIKVVVPLSLTHTNHYRGGQYN